MLDALSGKVLLDLALPLERSEEGPRLQCANDDSLGESVQRAFPEAKVVKTLHTVHVQVMVDPSRVPGFHNVFVAGDDSEAKATVRGILSQFGWPEGSVIDLGGIVASRAVEMYAPLYFALSKALGTYDLNISVVRARDEKMIQAKGGKSVALIGPY